MLSLAARNVFGTTQTIHNCFRFVSVILGDCADLNIYNAQYLRLFIQSYTILHARLCIDSNLVQKHSRIPFSILRTPALPRMDLFSSVSFVRIAVAN